MHKIFVYGTLKRGYGNNRLLAESRFIGNAVTMPALFMADHGIPFVWTSGGPLRRIAGELYEVDDAVLARLDRLEGHPTNYHRELVEIEVNGEHAEAFIYLYRHIEENRDVRPAPVKNHRYCWKGFSDVR